MDDPKAARFVGEMAKLSRDTAQELMNGYDYTTHKNGRIHEMKTEILTLGYAEIMEKTDWGGPDEKREMAAKAAEALFHPMRYDLEHETAMTPNQAPSPAEKAELMRYMEFFQQEFETALVQPASENHANGTKMEHQLEICLREAKAAAKGDTGHLRYHNTASATTYPSTMSKKEDDQVVVIFQDLPKCYVLATDEVQAIKKSEKAIAHALDRRLTNGEDIPVPSIIMEHQASVQVGGPSRQNRRAR